MSVTPPPGTIPSLSAAFTACTASSTRNFFSSISVSVAPPTLMTATLPDKAACRFSSCSLSYSLVAASACAAICLTRAVTSAGGPPPSIMVVSSLVTMTRRADPTIFRSGRLERMTEIFADDFRARQDGDVGQNVFAAITKSRRLNSHRVETPFRRFKISVPSASPSRSSATITRSFLPACASFSSSGRNSCTLEIFLSVMTTAGFGHKQLPCAPYQSPCTG